MVKLVLIIGVPGTGKSTLAKKIVRTMTNRDQLFVHRETDEYFTDTFGNYLFDPTKLGEYHALCQRMTESDLSNGVGVVVSNTNLTKWERSKYFDIARRTNATVIIFIMRKQYGNVHEITEEKIRQMEEKFEEVSSDEFVGLNVQFMDPNFV